MATWEWKKSRSKTFEWKVAQNAQRDDGTWPSDIVYEKGPMPTPVTLTAQDMTAAEAEAEMAKWGTQATYTAIDGTNGTTSTITGFVGGVSEGETKSSGMRTVTVTLTQPYVEE